MILDARCPTGPIEKRWDERRFHAKLVNPANRRKYRVIVVGSGLAESCGVGFSIGRASSAVARIIELCGLDEKFPTTNSTPLAS